MFKPGYQWNETLQKCLGAEGGGEPDSPPKMPTTDAIAMELTSRENTVDGL